MRLSLPNRVAAWFGVDVTSKNTPKRQEPKPPHTKWSEIKSEMERKSWENSHKSGKNSLDLEKITLFRVEKEMEIFRDMLDRRAKMNEFVPKSRQTTEKPPELLKLEEFRAKLDEEKHVFTRKQLEESRDFNRNQDKEYADFIRNNPDVAIFVALHGGGFVVWP